jgi:diguanylate cyclase (GGDEF)-like protein
VLLVDLDGLKYVNDTLGHTAGDELIRAAAGVLSYCARPGDVLARLGGDEFVLLLAGDHADAGARVRRILHQVAQVNGRPRGLVRSHAADDDHPSTGGLSMSSGSSLWHPPHTTLQEVLHRADEAMYQRKRHGGLRAAPPAPGGPSAGHGESLQILDLS